MLKALDNLRQLSCKYNPYIHQKGHVWPFQNLFFTLRAGTGVGFRSFNAKNIV